MAKRINSNIKDSVSVIIPAYNEEENIELAARTVINVLSNIGIKDYEILIINDGSTDRTKTIINNLAGKNTHIRTIHHVQNQGIGSAFRTGIQNATKVYFTGFPADMDWSIDSFKNLVLAKKEHCFVSCYLENMEDRQFRRQLISQSFTIVMNIIFRLKFRYYNGYFICPTEILKQIEFNSDGFTIFAEIKVKVIRKGVTFIEISSEHRPRLHGVSKAYTVKNILRTFSFLPSLINDIYF